MLYPRKKTPFLRIFLRIEAHKPHARCATAASQVLADDFLILSHNDSWKSFVPVRPLSVASQPKAAGRGKYVT
jgi:hypothetical protein